jgi:hypothetical protein
MRVSVLYLLVTLGWFDPQDGRWKRLVPQEVVPNK